MKAFRLLLVILLALGVSSSLQAQEKKKGKLSDFADDFKKKKKNDKDDNDGKGDSEGGGLLGVIVDLMVSSDNDNPGGPKKLVPYPYQQSNGLPLNSDKHRDYSVLAEAGYLNLGDGLHGVQLSADLRSRRFAAGFESHTLIESLDKEDDQLTFLGLNAGYELIAAPNLLARPFLGARNLSGLGLDIWGPEAGARLLMFPRKPVSVEASVSHARLNGKPLTLFSGMLGIMINRFEIRLGAQAFRSEWTSLEGLRVGMRLWM